MNIGKLTLFSLILGFSVLVNAATPPVCPSASLGRQDMDCRPDSNMQTPTAYILRSDVGTIADKGGNTYSAADCLDPISARSELCLMTRPMAEAYCSSVGKSLPTVDDFRYTTGIKNICPPNDVCIWTFGRYWTSSGVPNHEGYSSYVYQYSTGGVWYDSNTSSYNTVRCVDRLP